MDQNYTITSAAFDHTFDGKFGPMHSYNLTIADMGGQLTEVYINQKPETSAPMNGQTLFGHLEEDKLGNPKFVKAPLGPQKPPAATPAPPPAHNQPQSPYRQEDPDKQKIIVRQNALSNAVQNAQARSQVFIAQKRFDEAERVLKPSSIAFIQMWLYRATMGEWRPDIKPGEALELLGYSQSDIERFIQERHGSAIGPEQEVHES